MKVAINVTPLKSGHKGRGIGSYTRSLIEALEKRDDIELIKWEKIDEIGEVDLIHYPWFDLFYNTLSFKKKIPTVITVHDAIPLVFPDKYPLGAKGKISLFLQKIKLKNCRMVLTDSDNSKKDIIKFLGIKSEKIKVIPLAADERFQSLSDSAKINIKRRLNLPDRFLLFVGDANYVKNLPFLIKGFKKITGIDQFKDLFLVLVGGVFLKKVDDIDHPELKSLKLVNRLISDNDLNKKVIRMGQIDILDLVGLYNLATLYIQPSLYEGFGLPVLEAMQSGCPVLCSSTASLKEVTGNAAYLFDPKNLEQFLSSLEEVLEDKSLRRKLSRLGLTQSEKFSWAKVADETIRAYQQSVS